MLKPNPLTNKKMGKFIFHLFQNIAQQLGQKNGNGSFWRGGGKGGRNNPCFFFILGDLKDAETALDEKKKIIPFGIPILPWFLQPMAIDEITYLNIINIFCDWNSEILVL